MERLIYYTRHQQLNVRVQLCIHVRQLTKSLDHSLFQNAKSFNYKIKINVGWIKEIIERTYTHTTTFFVL